jgi:hypothetical protein
VAALVKRLPNILVKTRVRPAAEFVSARGVLKTSLDDALWRKREPRDAARRNAHVQTVKGDVVHSRGVIGGVFDEQNPNAMHRS